MKDLQYYKDGFKYHIRQMMGFHYDTPEVLGLSYSEYRRQYCPYIPEPKTTAHKADFEELILSAWSHEINHLVNPLPRIYVMVPALDGGPDVPIYLDTILYEDHQAKTVTVDGRTMATEHVYLAWDDHPVDVISRYSGLAQRNENVVV